jgi:hypothetical protein
MPLPGAPAWHSTDLVTPRLQLADALAAWPMVKKLMYPQQRVR